MVRLGIDGAISDIDPALIGKVEPLLSGHPRGNGKWSLNRGWPLNHGSS